MLSAGIKSQFYFVFRSLTLYEAYDFINGIEAVEREDTFDGTYHVYNLNGANVLTTSKLQDLRSLSTGLYIVNGKKVQVKGQK